MTNMIRAVVDTNVLVSGLIGGEHGNPHQIYLAFKKQKFILVTAVSILEELEDVIHRDHIVKKYYLTPSERKEMMETLVDLAVVVPGMVKVAVVKDDPDDDKFVSSAVEGDADYIVSGDPHLLKLKQYKSIKIVTPKEFVEILNK